VSFVYADDWLVNFTHIVGRNEYAVVEVVQKPGQLIVSCSYKPPYRLRIRIAGLEFEWTVNTYDFNRSIELLAYGVFKVYTEIEREEVLLRGEDVINLKTSYEVKLLDDAGVILPTVSHVTRLLGIGGLRSRLQRAIL